MKKILALLISVSMTACAGDLRFVRPGEYVAPTPPKPTAPILREENFAWGRPSGHAWFFWISPSRARASDLYRGLRFGASAFGRLAEALLSGVAKTWVPCAWAYCQEGTAAAPFDVDAITKFIGLQEGGPAGGRDQAQNFSMNVLEVLKRQPSRWKSQRWVHVFVSDIDDLLVRPGRTTEDYWPSLQALTRGLDEIDGFSRARLQFTLANYQMGQSRERCPRLESWEGRQWKALRDSAGGMATFSTDIDVCSVLQGDEAPMRQLAEDAARFQTRLILARSTDSATMAIEVEGQPLRREDFAFDPSRQEVKIHESVARGIAPGAKIKILYWEILK